MSQRGTGIFNQERQRAFCGYGSVSYTHLQRITVLEEYEEPSAEDRYNVELKEALGQLDEKYRIVLVLYYSCLLYTSLQKDFIHLGCYFSVNASMVKNMDVVNAIPKDRLLIESDGPYSKRCV